MREYTDAERNAEALADAANTIDDDELADRLAELARLDPDAAIDAGERLATSSDVRRREIGFRLIGLAGQADGERLGDRARPLLREALVRETNPEAIGWAIAAIGSLWDRGARDLVLAHAADPDPEVREIVADVLGRISMDADGRHDADCLRVLRELTTDEVDEVRNWATFGIGQLDDTDDTETRDALLARLDDQHDETRMEAIVGLARRRDERVRRHLLRELEDPQHAEIFDDALEVLDGGYNYLAMEAM